jgi:type II restriction/modification system DNA methylase subunit YeeA
MNTAQIKAYAPRARNDFIKAVTQRAARFGIHGVDNIDPVEFKGDVAIINDQAFTRKGGELREKLVVSVRQKGFEIFIRSNSYTWFNRFIAIRYMELHDFLDHGLRVLSNPTGSDIPEILEHATEVDLPSLDKAKIMEMRLEGDKDNELYKMLVIAQCNALHKAMPFLFDPVDSEAELLLPDNLLHSNSPVKKLVDEIDEALWENVEIIGWIYQFYISEKKDEVIGKVVKSKDIPAATQLFTPNWIVKYMVQNTLGKMWMATYPNSSLKKKMEYYIEPAKQEPEVQKEIDAITPEELNPEDLTFFDPACGSGHILVETYDIFKRIYLERGYRTRDIPRLILEKNIYGLDIDDRAAQLAFFSVLMKARQDDRRILNRDGLKLNILSIQESLPDDTLQVETFFQGKNNIVMRDTIKELLSLFENGKTFGSLILIPEEIATKINEVKEVVDNKLKHWGSKSSVQILKKIIDQAWILSKKFDCVVANPPYMGWNGMNNTLKNFAKIYFPNSKTDTFSMFADKQISMLSDKGYIGMVMPYVWMFIPTYSSFRKRLVDNTTINSLIELEYNAFEPACVPVATFTLSKKAIPKYQGDYIKLSEFKGFQNQAPKTLEAIKNPKCGWRYTATTLSFKSIPERPIAYWVSQNILNIFSVETKVSASAETKSGLSTGDKKRFVRIWSEVEFGKINFNGSTALTEDFKWCCLNSGGPFRKWYGNLYNVINWYNNGAEVRDFKGSTIRNPTYYFRKGLTWSDITSGKISVRFMPEGFIFEDVGPAAFFNDETELFSVLGQMNTTSTQQNASLLNPTLHFKAGNFGNLPILNTDKEFFANTAKQAVLITKIDWDSFETSWEFEKHPLLLHHFQTSTIKKSFESWNDFCQKQTSSLKELEEANNKKINNLYKINNEIPNEVPIREISLSCNPVYRYGIGKLETEYQNLFLFDTIKELISYFIGCIMGRYDFEKSGLIYANSSDKGFEPSNYKAFPADDDGIVPIMDMDWFEDNASQKFIEFIKTAWPPENFDENIKFTANCLKPKVSEAPEDTIRRYLSVAFFKDHMKIYKKRPIYWLFSSGKHKAFECLVYLHRYNDSTLSRMRSSYVTPLQGNISARIEFLEHEKDASTTASAQKKMQKQIDILKKKQVELKTFDDELRHYADMKISLDLDDGVKVNYGKFGNLLAQKKAITGTK